MQNFISNEVLVDQGDHKHYVMERGLMPIAGTEMIFINGLKQMPSDYVIDKRPVLFSDPADTSTATAIVVTFEEENQPSAIVSACYCYNN